MAEQQPLLSPHEQPASEDLEAGGGEDCEKGVLARWKEHTAETLESRPWHYTVILLARICSSLSMCHSIAPSVVVITVMACTGRCGLCLRARRSRIHAPLRHMHARRRA